MATPSKIIYVNFNECADAGMFRRRLDGIRRYAKARGMEVARLGRDDCAVEKVPEALARLRPMGCVVEPPFLRPGFFRRFPSVYFDVPRMPKWRSITASVRCDETAVAEAAYRELAAGMPPVFAVVSRWMFFHTWPAERINVFRNCCRRDGRECLVLDGMRGESEEAFRARLGTWVASLPHRCAIFAVNDAIAKDVAKALRAAQRSMPHDATLVGANAADPGDSACVHAPGRSRHAARHRFRHVRFRLRSGATPDFPQAGQNIHGGMARVAQIVIPKILWSKPSLVPRMP